TATIHVLWNCLGSTVARFSLGIAAAALVLVAPAHATWTVTTSDTQRSAAASVEHWRIGLAENSTGTEATLELAVFSSKTATLRVLDDADGSGTLAGAMQREQGIAGVNGGYFDPQNDPVGLLISDGRLIAPLRKARLLSGVVSVAGGRVQIQRSAEYSAKMKPTAARQCGPFLVERGQPIAGLNATRSARRTFVATMGGERGALGYCSHVTLAQLAALLATPGLAPELKVQRALNLDGGSSSAFWFAGQNGVISIREQKSVRDYLGLVPK
ncbi:MAG: phosphodiester glycosidase family protein, partial [Verrucomicrobiota bacterium]|nr:phosphodiester glycosidase family protein [Verrucomicrobiota bacterium]